MNFRVSLFPLGTPNSTKEMMISTPKRFVVLDLFLLNERVNWSGCRMFTVSEKTTTLLRAAVSFSAQVRLIYM